MYRCQWLIFKCFIHLASIACSWWGTPASAAQCDQGVCAGQPRLLPEQQLWHQPELSQVLAVLHGTLCAPCCRVQ